jgi:SPP1 gp7 family putative phage head morphogenesis protein
MPSPAEKARKYITPTSLPMNEAVEFWMGKTPAERSDLNATAKSIRGKAFIVSGITDADMLQRVYDEIGRALSAGTSFRDFKKNLAGVWKKAGFTGGKAYRIENIFRTNMQSAYAAGRYKQMRRVASRRPFWQYRAVGDQRTRQSHAAMNGLVFPADDPIWNTWYPPNGYMCRCKVRSLSARQVKKQGIKVEKGTKVIMPPDPGFRNNPGKTFFKPSFKKYRADIRQNSLSRFVDGLCPDKNYADEDSPCLRKLKKLLSREDLEALQTIMWEKKTGGVAGYESWVDSVLKRGQAKGELYPIGNLPAKVLSRLDKQPLMALTVIDDNQMLHLSRPKKTLRDAALTAAEIKDIPRRFASSVWYVDSENPAVLMTWQRFGDKYVKVVIRLDRRVGKAGVVANEVITAGIVEKSNLDERKYKKL